LTVTDQGLGFDWSDYQEIKPERLLESHGRGIAMAKALSFDHLEYVGSGNRVFCVVRLAAGEESKIPLAVESSNMDHL
jgi:hypothetical protein